MIEPFCSVYTKSYRSSDREPQLEAARSCAYFKDLGENFLPLEDSKTIYNPERDESVIKELHLKSLISTYQQSYCFTEGKRSMVIDPDNLEEDQFMVYFNKYYAPRMGAVPRPLETARRIHGYSRFEHYYTGRSTLEDTIYRKAYEYFKKDYDRGKSRLFAKKQKAMHEERRRAKGEGEERIEETKEEEVKPEVRREQPQRQLSKEKICQICCEKFGNFCYPPPHPQPNPPSQNCQK